MEKKKNPALRIAGFLAFSLLGILLLCYVNYIFIPPWNYSKWDLGEGSRARNYNEMADGTLDYLIAGVCHGYYSINPMQIYAEQGYTGYNLCGPDQSQACAYYLIREAASRHPLKYVFLDVSSLIREDLFDSEDAIKMFVYMKPSLLKLEAALHCSPDPEALRTILFPLYGFHERWEELETEDFTKKGDEPYLVRGATLRFRTGEVLAADEMNYEEKIDLTIGEDGEVEETQKLLTLSEEGKEWFSRTDEFCRKQGIALVPVKFPTKRWNSRYTEIVSEYLETKGYSLMDLYDNEELGIQWPTDSPDEGYHTNYFGNVKTTHYFAEYLKELRGLQDHRGEEKYADWDSALSEYREWERDECLEYMRMELKVYRYLSLLAGQKENLMILMAGKYDVSGIWNDFTAELFRELGLTSDFSGHLQESFLAVSDRGVVKPESWNERRLSYEFEFTAEDGSSHEALVLSAGAAASPRCTLSLDGEDYEADQDGLNFLVLDPADGKILSSAYIGLSEEGTLEIHEKRSNWKKFLEGRSPLEDGIYTLIPGGGSREDFKVQITGVPGEYGLVRLSDPETGLLYVPDRMGNTSGTEVVLMEQEITFPGEWLLLPLENGALQVISPFSGLSLSLERNTEGGKYALTLRESDPGDPSQSFFLQNPGNGQISGEPDQGASSGQASLQNSGNEQFSEEAESFYRKLREGRDVNVLIVGDSIAYGSGVPSGEAWPELLRDYLQEQYQVRCNLTNLSMGGSTSYGGYVRGNILDDGLDYDLAVICYGENDGTKALPVEYEAIIRSLSARYARCSLISILESSQKKYTPKIRSIQELADYYGIPTVDAIEAFSGSGFSYEELTLDEKHPNEQGHRLYFETLKEIIDRGAEESAPCQVFPADPLNGVVEEYDSFRYFSPESFTRDGDRIFRLPVSEALEGIPGIYHRYDPGDGSVSLYVDGVLYGEETFEWPYDFSQEIIYKLGKTPCRAEREIRLEFSSGELAEGFRGLIFTGLSD